MPIRTRGPAIWAATPTHVPALRESSFPRRRPTVLQRWSQGVACRGKDRAPALRPSHLDVGAQQGQDAVQGGNELAGNVEGVLRGAGRAGQGMVLARRHANSGEGAAQCTMGSGVVERARALRAASSPGAPLPLHAAQALAPTRRSSPRQGPSPAIARINVDLPLPFGPSSAVIFPRGRWGTVRFSITLRLG